MQNDSCLVFYHAFSDIAKNQQYALNFTTPLFNIQAPTCFGSGLPSSGSFLDSSELLEMQIEEAP
jgi:hypothetical protein